MCTDTNMADSVVLVSLPVSVQLANQNRRKSYVTSKRRRVSSSRHHVAHEAVCSRWVPLNVKLLVFREGLETISDCTFFSCSRLLAASPRRQNSVIYFKLTMPKGTISGIVYPIATRFKMFVRWYQVSLKTIRVHTDSMPSWFYEDSNGLRVCLTFTFLWQPSSALPIAWGRLATFLFLPLLRLTHEKCIKQLRVSVAAEENDLWGHSYTESR